MTDEDPPRLRARRKGDIHCHPSARETRMLAEFAVLKPTRDTPYPDDAVLLLPSDVGVDEWVESGSVEFSSDFPGEITVRLTRQALNRLTLEGDFDFEIDQLEQAVRVHARMLDPTLTEDASVAFLSPEGGRLIPEEN